MRILKSKSEVLREFAQRVPNAETMAIDWGRDKLTVFFDGIHSFDYGIKHVLKAYETAAKNRGLLVIWENEK